MESFLSDLGIENSISAFQKYKLTLEMCPYISDIDLKELIPDLGDRTKFRMALSKKSFDESDNQPTKRRKFSENHSVKNTFNMVSTF